MFNEWCCLHQNLQRALEINCQATWPHGDNYPNNQTTPPKSCISQGCSHYFGPITNHPKTWLLNKTILCFLKVILAYLIYNVVLVSAVQKSESVLYIYIYPLFFRVFPHIATILFCSQSCGLVIQEGLTWAFLTWVAVDCSQMLAGASVTWSLDAQDDPWLGAHLGLMTRAPTQTFPIGRYLGTQAPYMAGSFPQSKWSRKTHMVFHA